MGAPINQRPPQLHKSVWSRDGIGLEHPEIRRRTDAKLGSMILREACLDLFQRTANRFQIDLAGAMVRHLGRPAKPAIPGTERIYRGDAAKRRLAA